MSNFNAVDNGLPRMITDITKAAAKSSETTVPTPKLPELPPEFAYGGEWMDPQWKKDARDYKKFFINYPIQMSLLLVAAAGLAFGLACAKGAKNTPGDAEAAGSGCGSSQTEQADDRYEEMLGGELSGSEEEDQPISADNSGLYGTESAVSGDIGDGGLAIKGFSFCDNYDGEPAIVIEFDYTNNGSEEAPFYLHFLPQAYQDGVQLEDGYDMTGTFDNQEMVLNVQPGATFTVHRMFKLRSDTSPVQLKVSDILQLSSDTLETTFEISDYTY